MSRLEELIQELCPNGVEYKFIAECVQEVKKINWKKDEEGCYQYIDLSSVDREKHKIIETQIINSGNAPSRAQQIIKTCDILFGTTRPLLKRYCFIDAQFDGQICSTGFCVLRADKNIVLPRWLYHNISADAFFSHVERFQKGASYPAISDSNVKNFKIPVPPLEVQREIVRILDNFTEITAELQKELTAELTARKKQYEYYRDQLFEFDESIPHIQLKDLAKINIGLATSVTQHKCDNGVILIHNSDIQQNVIRLKSIEFISEDFAKKHEKKRLRKGDIITVHTGDVGTSAVIGDQFDGAIGFTTITTRIQDKEIINEFYLCHYFNSYRCKKDISLMTISDRSNLNQKSFEKLLIPVPSIEQQRRIVTILNRFDVICNDLKNGLPAEVEARKKQYEYYRDTLLNFERLEE